MILVLQLRYRIFKLHRPSPVFFLFYYYFSSLSHFPVFHLSFNFQLSTFNFHDPWLPSVLLRSEPTTTTTRWLSSPGLVQGQPWLDLLELGLRCLRLRLRLSLILVSLSMGCTCPTRLLSPPVHLGPTTPS